MEAVVTLGRRLPMAGKQLGEVEARPSGLAPLPPPTIPRPDAATAGVKVVGVDAPGEVSRSPIWREHHQHGLISNIWRTFLFVLQAAAFPLWPIFISWGLRDWSFTRRYFHTLAYCAKTAFPKMNGHSSISRMIKYNILTTPAQLEAQLQKRRGACTRCARCCKALDCIFLGYDEEASIPYCRAYGTRYWHFGTCGRYPIDQSDVDDHGCPGFSFPDEEHEPTSTIRETISV